MTLMLKRKLSSEGPTALQRWRKAGRIACFVSTWCCGRQTAAESTLYPHVSKCRQQQTLAGTKTSTTNRSQTSATARSIGRRETQTVSKCSDTDLKASTSRPLPCHHLLEARSLRVRIFGRRYLRWNIGVLLTGTESGQLTFKDELLHEMEAAS